MRVAAPAFGPLPLVMLRLTGAALFFMPWLLQARNRPLVRAHAGRLVVLGLLNSALPFSLLAFASLQLEAGFTSVLGATVPLFATAVDALWWRHALTLPRILGIVLGFCGVLVLAFGHVGLHSVGSAVAFGAALLASLCYGIAAHYGKHHLERLKLIAQLSDRGLRVDAIGDLMKRIDRGEVDLALRVTAARWRNAFARVALGLADA